MAIIQISKIQHRSGDLVDLPQLDEAELGFASDERRLFIGKTTGNVENIEVLTSYSTIDFNQINGSYGNLDVTINSNTANSANGQVLTFDGTNWVNRGGDQGGLITLGDVSNLKITGGAIGYVLETDGTGNLSWTPKSTIIAFVENASNANPVVITTTEDNFFTQGAEITLTNLPTYANCVSEILNGNVFYADVLTSNTFALYTDPGLSSPVDGSGEDGFPYTTVSATSTSGSEITVADSSVFVTNDPIVFKGDTDQANSQIVEGTVYYVKTKPNSTTLTISDEPGGNTFAVGTSTISVEAYSPGGRIVSAIGGSGSAAAGGANTTIQYNDNNLLNGNASFTYNNATKVMTLSGNANIGNLNATGTISGTRLISNISTGTAPITVTSTTRVANLNVEYANVADFINVNTVTTGTFYPVLSNSLSGNVVEGANANLSFDAATGTLSTTNLNSTLLTGTLTTAAQPNITSLGTLSSLGVNGTLTAINITSNTGIFSGNGSGISALNASNLSSGTVPSARLSGTYTITVSGSATTAGTVTTAAQPNITSVGTLTSLGVNGTITAVNITANTGIISGNGSGLSALNASNLSTGTVPSARLSGSYSISVTSATTAGTVTTNAQPNITSVGTLTSLSVSGNISAGNVNSTGLLGGTGAQFRGNVISTGANTTAGTITGNWTLTSGSRLQATYADLAEYYAADNNYTVGTVLQFGGEHEVTLAGEETNKLAGVVSTEPAYVMNGGIQCEYPTIIALIGRVPVKVIGPVSKGDMLVSAGQGLAKATIMHPKVGTVIGKAIQNKYDDAIGMVEVLVGRI